MFVVLSSLSLKFVELGFFFVAVVVLVLWGGDVCFCFYLLKIPWNL